MNISIKNFGPIKQFDFDLTKDIIVTYGENNIGKSYAMQIVYLLLKNLNEYAEFYNGFYGYSYAAQLRFHSNHLDKMKQVVDDFSKSADSTREITEEMNAAVLVDLIDKFISNFLNSSENTFGNFKSILTQHPSIELEVGNYRLIISLADEQPLKAHLYSTPTFLKRASSDFHKSRNANGKLDIYYYKDAANPLDIISYRIIEAITAFTVEVSTVVGNVYFLPASRSGIYSGMSAFSSIIAELSKNKAFLTKKLELPGISEPISDYFLMLSGIRSKENSAYSEIYKKIESDILNGTVSFNRSRNTLVYTPDGLDHEFDMTEVSSMVSEISPIVAFLKYIISSNNYRRTKIQKATPMVFIEEPEAHLHPKNQIKLIALFAQLHNLGIKIIVSSHSNYIFNKLNNLLLKEEISLQVYSAILLQAEAGGSKSNFMAGDELGIDDTNFMDVTQELYNERENLIDMWNNQ